MDKIERINVWYDNASPRMEVIWRRAYGYVTPTENQRVDVKVDYSGNALGFMLTGIRHLRGQTLDVSLWPVAIEEYEALRSSKSGADPAIERAVGCGNSPIEKIRFKADDSGDCIEVRWGSETGHYTTTDNDQVRALRDSSGNVIGFKISGIGQMGEGESDFINVDLYPQPTPQPSQG